MEELLVHPGFPEPKSALSADFRSRALESLKDSFLEDFLELRILNLDQVQVVALNFRLSLAHWVAVLRLAHSYSNWTAVRHSGYLKSPEQKKPT